MLLIVLIDEISLKFTEITVNASNRRYQSPKMTKLQPKLKISKSEPNWLSIAYK